jgi:hypothetical protein
MKIKENSFLFSPSFCDGKKNFLSVRQLCQKINTQSLNIY